MYHLVVNLYYKKDITRFGLNRAKIGNNNNIPFSLFHSIQYLLQYNKAKGTIFFKRDY
jgi:hypothetical protein